MQYFRAGCVVAPYEGGRMIADRVACRHVTQNVQERQDQGGVAKARYRLEFMQHLCAACPQNEEGRALVQKFKDLVATLTDAKGLALPAIHTTATADASVPADPTWYEMANKVSAFGGAHLDRESRILRHRNTQAGLIHPLLIAVLAYRLGGAVNAAYSAYAHTWSMPTQSDSAETAQDFHREGDTGNIFDDHRVTFVWEPHNGGAIRPSGEHHLFFSGEATPQLLRTATSNANLDPGVPLTILYDKKNAALFYESQKGALRQSISLDFHLYIKPTDEAEHGPVLDPEEMRENTTFLDLLTSVPISNYESHFQRLLWSPGSLRAIVQTLSELNPPDPCPRLPPSQATFVQRLEAYRKDNIANTPAEVLNMTKDLQISGLYAAPNLFFQKVVRKAYRDAHLHLGWDLFPHEATDESREIARKFFRDMSPETISTRMGHYRPALAHMLYIQDDLLTTRQLQAFAQGIQERCLQLTSSGYICVSGVLPYIPSFCRALGNALNGQKEAQNPTGSWYEECGFQIYRTRCLYLFWCADFLMNYLERPLEGPFMVTGKDHAAMARIRSGVVYTAQILVRNWVAWGMLVEDLPKGGFSVKSSVVPHCEGSQSVTLS